MTTAAPSRPHISHLPHRHHPYAPPAPPPPPASSSSSSASTSRPKWQTRMSSPGPSSVDNKVSSSHHHHPNGAPRYSHATARSPRPRDEPPSPPRSGRDHSETPSVGLSVAFGGAQGGKWWDEELPAPPASLTAILDSFRKSGEGDRDLLLSILGAKKAEEERLTALIQTRLTILQARLQLHSTAAQLSTPPITPPFLPPVDVTPGLASRNSAASNASSTQLASPRSAFLPPGPGPVSNSNSHKDAYSGSSGYHLPPPSSLVRGSSRSPNLPPLRLGGRDLVEEDGNVSPKSAGSAASQGSSQRDPGGLEMLLDVGMRVGGARES